MTIMKRHSFRSRGLSLENTSRLIVESRFKSPSAVPESCHGLGNFYKRKILEEIGSLIGKVTKLDFKIDCGSRGRFACMAVFINLKKPLIPHVLINGTVQCIEYDSLLVVCFLCGRYSHVRDLCLSKETVMNGEMAKEVVIVDLPEKEKEKMEESSKSFGPRMFVERKSLNNSRGNENLTTKILPKQGMGF
ncbi:hypothetical protein PVK06_002643 [Gossypium arboreum]|uniref:Zinc knuckle CX2CX4HX4C domain-containing protein n=1 Tax=Gossypium arboreum TaxID=29729 RepID=A0ABR0R438_GOSAR|nr:hypothetical protein PVK06_002643 [Gossypium arboreum]